MKKCKNTVTNFYGVLFLALPIFLSANSDLNNALKEYNSGNFESSYNLLKNYIYANKADENVIFAYARSAYEMGMLEEAKLIYLELLKAKPDNARLKLELAQIYSRDPKTQSKANEIYQEILKISDIPDNVKNKINLALNSLNQEDKNHLFSLFFGLGIGHDTNAYNSSKDNFVNVKTPIGEFPFKIHDGRTADRFIEYFLSLKHTYKINDYLELKNKFVLYFQKYRKADSEDVGVGSFETGLSHTDNNIQKELALSYGHVLSDDKSNIRIYSVSPSIDYVVNDKLLYKGKVKLSKKDFVKNEDKFKNSKRVEFSNSLSYMTQSFGMNTIEFSIGLENADGIKKLNVDNNFFAIKYENLYPLTKNTVLISGIEYNDIKYKVKESFLYNSSRKDKKYTFDSSLLQSITQKLSIGLNYRYIDNKSNQSVYRYQKGNVKLNMFYSL